MDGFRVRYSYSLLRSSNVLASLVAVPGTAEEGAMDFLKLTGAPSDLWFAFRTGQMKACMEREILEVVNSFGAVNYTHHSDTIFYFRKWGLDKGEAVEPVLISDGVYAYLHDDNKEVGRLDDSLISVVKTYIT